MCEQVHPYCLCLYYAANALARNISRPAKTSRPHGIGSSNLGPRRGLGRNSLDHARMSFALDAT